MSKVYLLVAGLLFFSQNADAQIDTVPPVLVCKNMIPIYLSDFCYGYVKAQDLVDTVYDDSQYYDLSLRKQCTGDGFPATDSLVFLQSESAVELWARDSTGNTSTCTTTVYFYDPGFCDFGSSLSFTTAEHDGIDAVSTHVYGTNCLLDSIDYNIPTNNLGLGYGWTSWAPGNWMTYGSFVKAAGYSYDIVPSRNDNPLNGVTTYDMVLISKHILGIESFDSPYKILAADVNLDGKVTTYDIVLIRMLILGIITQLPHGKSWRFIPDDYVFPNPQNPFDSLIPDRITVPRSYEFPYGSHDFLGIKIGDVNFTADPD